MMMLPVPRMSPPKKVTLPAPERRTRSRLVSAMLPLKRMLLAPAARGSAVEPKVTTPEPEELTLMSRLSVRSPAVVSSRIVASSAPDPASPIVIAPRVPSALLLRSESVPLLSIVPPENVLATDNLKVPVPRLTSVPTPNWLLPRIDPTVSRLVPVTSMAPRPAEFVGPMASRRLEFKVNVPAA